MRWSALVLLFACNGGKDTTDDGIIPVGDADTDADSDSDTDTDADTDADTDTEPVDRCAPLEVPSDAIPVAATDDLAAAVAAAPSGATLALADGTYDLTAPIVLDKPITLISAAASSTNAIVDGGYVATHLFEVTSSGVTLAHLTLSRSYDDLIVVTPTGADADGLVVHGDYLLDPGRYALTATSDWDAGFYADGGTVSCSTVELTTTGRGEIRGLCETGGVDLYGAQGWTVRDNAILGFYCDFGLSGPGIRATRGSRDTIITRNQLSDVAYGLVLGETQDQIGRLYDDQPCGIDDIVQHVDGVVTNNMVAAFDEDLVTSSAGVQTGIRVESSCNALVAHNSVFSAVEPTSSSLEQRYPYTSGLLANNLLSHKLVRTDDALADTPGNIELAPFDSWYFPAGQDFHTSPGATWAIDEGDLATVGIVVDDVDGEPRDDGLPDIGADEQ